MNPNVKTSCSAPTQAGRPHLGPLPIRWGEEGGFTEALMMSEFTSRSTPAGPLAPSDGERVRVRGLRTRTVAAREFARRLRRESTDAEKQLWRLLRDRRFSEFKFRRQYPCGVYFLDFFCVAARLAVELDRWWRARLSRATNPRREAQYFPGRKWNQSAPLLESSDVARNRECAF